MNENKALEVLAPELPRKERPTGVGPNGRFNGPLPASVVRKRARTNKRLNVRHGLKAKANARIDKRRTVDRRVLETIAALETALGDRLSPQRRLILANIARKLLDLALIEAWEAENGTINTRKRALYAITEAKFKLLDSIDRALERLGLDVTARKATSLADVIASFKAGETSNASESSETSETTPVAGAAETQDELDSGDDPTG